MNCPGSSWTSLFIYALDFLPIKTSGLQAQELPGFLVPPSPAIPSQDKMNVVDQGAWDENKITVTTIVMTTSLLISTVMPLEVSS